MVVLLVDGPEKVWPHTVEGRSRVSERASAGAAKTPASRPAMASPNIGTEAMDVLRQRLADRLTLPKDSKVISIRTRWVPPTLERSARVEIDVEL